MEPTEGEAKPGSADRAGIAKRERPDRVDSALLEILESARSRGFLGPGEIGAHIAHARGFARVVERAIGGQPPTFCDLGTGGGVPGLVLASEWPRAAGCLVEANARRSRALRAALGRLEWAGRVEVIEARAEAFAHRPERRERARAVVARSFAGPAATAEIATGLLEVGGVLVVSEPPGGDSTRWPTRQLALLGLGEARVERAGHEFTYAVMRKTAAAPSEFPRGVGRPTKRPLW